MKIAVLPGDGIGQEIVPEAVKVLKAAAQGRFALDFADGHIGMSGVEHAGQPLPDATLALARDADAILFGSVGGPEYERYLRETRVRSGLLQLRLTLQMNANLRPVKLIPELAAVSTLKPEVIEGLDLLIVRELNGDIYFGEPRGPVENAQERESINTMRYRESQIRSIAHTAFRLARSRRGKLCSVDKANVLETMRLWRDVVTEVGTEYPDVELSHLYVDAAAMSLVRAPTQFDVIVTGNMFGDILSDEAAMLAGSLGMLPSASLSADGRYGLYEPIHGSAPDIAGKNIANPLATILSAAMLLRHSGKRPDDATRIEDAVRHVLASGLRTGDIMAPGCTRVGTREMGDAVAAALGS